MNTPELLPTETDLWCMHAIGPDDVFAAPSKEEAERAAAWYNERFKDAPEVRFAAIPWPHSADSHAIAVVDWDVETRPKENR